MSSNPRRASRQSWYSPLNNSRDSQLLPTFNLNPSRNSAPTLSYYRQSSAVTSPVPSSLSLPSSPASPSISTRQSRQSRRIVTQFRSGWGSTPQNSPVSLSPHRILFYEKDKPYYGFTNFSDHPVMYGGKRYPTSEHLFQSLKFQPHKPGLAEHIRTCSANPRVAFNEAHRFQPEARPDWKAVNIKMMDEVIWYKFTQHDDLREELLATGDAELVEDSAKDAFWGIGANGQGRNELGKALERLRDLLRGSK